MARALRTEVGRWIAALFVAALALAQVHGSAHALHARSAAGAYHPCPLHSRPAGAIQVTPDEHRKTPPDHSTKQLCCQAICVMAAVQLASAQVPVPTEVAAQVTPPSEHPATDGFPDRLDRPPKAAAAIG